MSSFQTRVGSVADIMHGGDRSARSLVRTVGDGVRCPTTRADCTRGCRTVCLLPREEKIEEPRVEVGLRKGGRHRQFRHHQTVSVRLNVSSEVHTEVLKRRGEGETAEDVLRRVLGLTPRREV